MFKEHSPFATNKTHVYQNIYITSDEEIKEGDWLLEKEQIVNKFPTYLTDLSECKKIILTTDPELIADDVQAVDEEFLQWCIKNPSCEYVDVVSLRKSSGYYDEKSIWHWDFLAYKTLIPQEESKQECKGSVLEQLRNHFVPREELKPTYEEIRKIADEIWNEQHDLIKDKNVIPEKYAARQMLMMNAHEVIDTRVHKEETLEESAERLITNPTLEDKLVFEEGAKWQAERMYSHTEVLAILEQFIEHPTKPGYKRSDVVAFIKQFKEKKNGQ
jgi:hypothetical protein